MADIQARTIITLASGASSSTTMQTVLWVGGPGTFSAEATFGGGTITLQVLSGNGTWIAVGTDTTLTANGIAGFILPKGAQIRVLIATATAVYAYAVPMS